MDTETIIWDKFAIVKDLKLKNKKKKDLKKSDIFETNEKTKLKPIVKKHGHKNGKSPFEKKDIKYDIQMW